MKHVNRRRLLQAIGALGTAPVWSRLASLSAYAATSAPGYKAAVCIALRGGNDANNLLIPMQQNAYSLYSQARGGLALPYGSLLALGVGGTYGLHPAFRNVQALYNAGASSIITGVGALHAPTTKATIQAGQANLPDLFSHTTGQSEWESGDVSAQGTTGWGGRVIEALSGRSGTLPGVISLAGNSLFLIGQNSPGFTLAQSNNYLPSISTDTSSVGSQLASLDLQSKSQLVRLSASARSGMLRNQAIIKNALTSAPAFQTVFPKTSIGGNLQTVAQMIAGKSVVGADRQMFFCQQGGFDTHISQLQIQNDNFSQLDAAIGAFHGAMQELGLQNQVLLFTISDFSRTYQPNTGGGTDHAWAGHQILVGGGVTGGKVVGTVPSGELGGSDDMTGQGAWIPTTSSVQMAGGIARWMGVADSDIARIFPDLSNFSSGALSI